MHNFYTNVSVQGGKILYRGFENGRRVQKRLDYSPTLFVPSSKKTPYTGIHGEFLDKIDFGSLMKAKDFIRKYAEVPSFKIYGQQRFEYNFISDMFDGHIDYDIENIVIANVDIEVGSDNGFPDPAVAIEPITAITAKIGSHIYAFGLGEFTHSRTDLTYCKCDTEKDLIKNFLNIWMQNYPDIFTGWNVKYFDIPYLINRTVKILGEEYANKLSPWGNLRLEVSEFMGQERATYKILGLVVWDYLQIFRKYSKGGVSHESYKLDQIAFDVLGKRKISYSEYGNLRRLYIENHQLFMEYNISDVELVDEIDAKEKIIDLCLRMSYDAKVNYDDVFSQVRMWDIIIYNHLKKKNIAIPPASNNTKTHKYMGAFVKEPLVGMHNWIASFDLTSLYPHLIMQWNISPDTIINPSEWSNIHDSLMKKHDISIDGLLKNGQINSEITKILKENKLTLTPNGQFFTVEKHGFLPEIMQTMYNDRDAYKSKMIEYEKLIQNEIDANKKKEYGNLISKLDNLQRAKKESLNSAYGALGNQWFRYFAIPLAEGVTSSGQLVIQWLGNDINKYLNKILGTEKDYIIASDTDSVYINMEGIVNMIYGKDIPNDHNVVISAMDKVCLEKIKPLISNSCQRLADQLNVYDQKMNMKREVLADRGIWRAKKKYLLYVYNSEGVQYKEPKLKISGLEAIRSSTPYACRAKIKEALKIILTKDENSLIDFIDDFRSEFENYPVEEISFPRSVNGIEEYEGTETNAIYKKGSPQHTKATLYYNDAIQKMNLVHKYDLIKEGEKIKFIHLKEPNKFKTPLIAFLERPPEEFELPKYIDYDLQFEKAFLDPLKLILVKIGWKTERKNSLTSFMR
jgi:DNA polymerase elongation subunit (family B)